MHIESVDGLPVRLRAPHELSFLTRWGRVFRVFDEQDSGNLCFGVEGEGGRVFVKYAGAPTLRYEGSTREAIERSRAAADIYRALPHPRLVRLRESVDLGAGHAMVFDWTEAVPLGRQFGRAQVLAKFDSASRARAVQQIYDFHAYAAAGGWVAVDLYDGSILIDQETGDVTLCDVDVYARAPMVNTMGRMWGSRRFMSPEEFQLGAPIDDVTNVFALGALAHTLLGDDETKSRGAWVGTDEQFGIAARALSPSRSDRWRGIASLAEAWRAAAAS